MTRGFDHTSEVGGSWIEEDERQKNSFNNVATMLIPATAHGYGLCEGSIFLAEAV